MYKGIEAGKYTCARPGAGNGVFVAGEWSEENAKEDPRGTRNALFEIIRVAEGTMAVCSQLGGRCTENCPVRQLQISAKSALKELRAS